MALAAAAKKHHLGSATIVGFGSESLPALPHFDGCRNLVLTPNIAGLSAQSKKRVSVLIADKMLAALR